MRFFLSFLALVPAILAAPVLDELLSGEAIIPDKWIVQVRPESRLEDAISQVTEALGWEPEQTFEIGTFQGFMMDAPNSLVDVVKAITHISNVTPDVKVNINALTTQPNAPYGLARVSHKQSGSREYVYDDTAGKDTFSYIIDTGIYTEHEDFEGRATFGANFAGDGNDRDGNGHGTHVAGTVGSATYGVAKKTSLIAVKVLNAEGTGSYSGILQGLDWAVRDMKTKNRVGKSVANLSLGGPYSMLLNQATAQAVREGLFVVVAAGNEGKPVMSTSPASESSACTVGAIDNANKRASFSNYGMLIDVFAPGVNIISTWIGGPAATNTISGTSMAAPHVAGVGAYLLALEGNKGAVQLCNRIKALSTKNQIPAFTVWSPNRIAYNGSSR